MGNAPTPPFSHTSIKSKEKLGLDASMVSDAYYHVMSLFCWGFAMINTWIKLSPL